MKETINYYYNLNIEEIEENDGKYHFIYQKKDFFFIFYNRLNEELDDIINCSRSLKERKIDCHDIILNKYGNVLTKVGDYNYLLLSVNNLDEEYDIIDIMDFNKKVNLDLNYSKLYRNNWPQLWSSKIDYFEYQISELGYQKTAVLLTFSYYIGLAENAVSYASKTINIIPKTINDRVTLSHRRIFYPNIKLNYLNPLSFVFDLEIRDVAEYIKSLFFADSDIDAFEELCIYLKTTKLSLYSYQMLYARLLYPSYYFDIYEDIMNKDCSEDKLIHVVRKVNEYELFLKKTYLEITKYVQIEKIDWIINLH